MMWLLRPGSRFYDILGILMLSVSVEFFMNGISRIKDGFLWLLCFWMAAGFAVTAGGFLITVVHDLQVYERICESDSSPDALLNVLEKHQAVRTLCSKIWQAILLFALSTAAVIVASLLGGRFELLWCWLERAWLFVTNLVGGR